MNQNQQVLLNFRLKQEYFPLKKLKYKKFYYINNINNGFISL